MHKAVYGAKEKLSNEGNIEKMDEMNDDVFVQPKVKTLEKHISAKIENLERGHVTIAKLGKVEGNEGNR